MTDINIDELIERYEVLMRTGTTSRNGLEQETITALRQQQDNLQACEIMLDTYKAAEKRLSTAPLPDEVAEASTWLREKCGGVGNKVADLIERLGRQYEEMKARAKRAEQQRDE